jgi:hypothetical protein
MYRFEQTKHAMDAMHVLMYPYYSTDNGGRFNSMQAYNRMASAILLAKLNHMAGLDLAEYIAENYTWVSCEDIAHRVADINFSAEWKRSDNRATITLLYYGNLASRILVKTQSLKQVLDAFDWQLSQVNTQSQRCKVCGMLKTTHGHCYLCTTPTFMSLDKPAKVTKASKTVDQKLAEYQEEVRRHFPSIAARQSGFAVRIAGEPPRPASASSWDDSLLADAYEDEDN